MTATGTEKDFRALAELYRQNLNGKADTCAVALGVAVESLERLGCGVDPDGVLCFPMQDADRRIIGIRRRFPDGHDPRYLSIAGGHNGLLLPDGESSGPLYLFEGCTDTLAGLSLGVRSIGRPSAADGIELVKAFCQAAGVTAAVIVGDSDTPGKLGVTRLADALVDTVDDIRIIYPAEGFKDIRDEYRAGGLTAEILRDRAARAERWTKRAGSSPVVAQVPEWPDHISLDEPDLPQFPIKGTPGPLADMALAVAGSLEIPVDMAAMIGITIGGLCLSKRAIVKPKPDWIESPNLYSLIGMDSGERKTPSIRIMAEPLERYEIEENERRAIDIRESYRKKALLEKRIEKLTAKAAAEDDGIERKNIELAIHELDTELAELELVYPVRLLTGDCTPEKMATLLFQNEGRIGIVTAEDILSTLTGRQYSSTGESNLSAILSGYSGDTIRVDRQGREPIIVRYPAITLCMAVQFDVLKSLKRDKAFRGRGLLARFCYCLPKSMIGNRSIHTDPIPETVRTIYQAAVLRLLQHGPNPDGPAVLGLDQDATDLLNVFRADTESRLDKYRGDLSPIGDWGSKLPGMVVRIAAILHGYGDPDYCLTKPIGADSMEPAIRIGGYLIEHAKAAFYCMGVDPTVTIAKKITGLLGEYGQSISRREIFERVKGLSDVQSSDDLSDPLRVLCEHGYIRPIEKDKGRGRPSERYEIRPDLPGKRSQNSQ